MRIFLAIEIPQNIKERLVEVQEDLKSQIPGIRWEKAEKLHITLVFLGQVPEERVLELKEVIGEGIKEVKGIKGLKIGFSEVGFFPKARPRVVLVEVGPAPEQVRCGVNEPVVELQKRLATALSGAGFEFARLSRPHVTLGRFKRGAKHTRRVCKKIEDETGFEVKEVVVMKSQLHSSGAIHTPVARIPLC